MARKTKAQILREGIKNDLIKQLESNGTVGKFYSDLVDDYMKLWDTKNLLQDDIAKRGANVPSIASTVVANIKRAGPIGELVNLNSELLELAIAKKVDDKKIEAIKSLAQANAKMIALLHDTAVTIKKNDSVSELVKVNAQMLKLLSELGIKPAQTGGVKVVEM